MGFYLNQVCKFQWYLGGSFKVFKFDLKRMICNQRLTLEGQ